MDEGVNFENYIDNINYVNHIIINNENLNIKPS